MNYWCTNHDFSPQCFSFLNKLFKNISHKSSFSVKNCNSMNIKRSSINMIDQFYTTLMRIYSDGIWKSVFKYTSVLSVATALWCVSIINHSLWWRKLKPKDFKFSSSPGSPSHLEFWTRNSDFQVEFLPACHNWTKVSISKSISLDLHTYWIFHV